MYLLGCRYWKASDANQKSAESAAYLHFLAKCHELGILMEILDRKSPLNVMNKQMKQKSRAEQRDAILDIFNYAARFDLVPMINMQAIQRMERRRPRRVIQVDIQLPEQGIAAKGYGNDLQAAEMEASLKFKQQAEVYQAKQGGESLIIKDSTALTIETTAKFLEFLKIVRPGIRLNMEMEETVSPLGRGINFKAQVRVNDTLVGEPVQMNSKTKAESAAWLVACVESKKKDPEIWPRYIRALQIGNGQILRPIAPIDMKVDEDCALVMRETLLSARKAGLPDEVHDSEAISDLVESRRGFTIRKLASEKVAARSEDLKQRFQKFTDDPANEDIRSKKADLPMNQYRDQVLDLVNNNIYSIVVGATGSGKTTQVPQILLEDAITTGAGGSCNIICTQPRRIAATSVARRVASEKAEKLQESVGYHVRFDPKPPQPGGSINYCTTGILLQQLQHSPDEIMDNTSHLVIDEVHERDTLIDFLLILLKKNMTRRRALGKSTPQVVLMSATMDTELFAQYFKSDTPDESSVACPSLSVPGRTFPVTEKYIDEILQDMNSAKTPMSALHNDPKTRQYLEFEREFQRERQAYASPESSTMNKAQDRSVIDWKRERRVTEDGQASIGNEKDNALIPFGLVAATIAHIARTTPEGAILVFLPGLEEIVSVEKDLQRSDIGINMADESRFRIYKLHSSIAASQQTVFETVPEGCRKIILSTNIAETSVTIPDVQHVVDTGKLREKQYDQVRRITLLLCTWISKSNAKQRAGRAGRVQNGNYYALYSKERYDSLRAIGLPELLRTDLQEVCLDIKAQAFNTPIREFLGDALEPPSPTSVDVSVINLQDLDALTDDEHITSLGRLLASLPVHPSLGKMIVLGIIFRCLDPMLVLGAASAERSLFNNPLEARKEAQAKKLSFVEGTASDHIALLNAVRNLRKWRDSHGDGTMRDYAHQHFLNISAFRVIDSTAKQIEEILIDAGLIPHTPDHRRIRSQYGDASLNQNSHKVPLVKALTLSGLHPNLGVCPGGGKLFRTPGEKNTLIHPGSTNAPKDIGRYRARDSGNEHTGVPPGTMYAYTALAKSNDGNTLFLRDTTETTPLQASLFGGKLRQNEERANVIELDNWLPFFVLSRDRRTAKTIIEFRKALERLLAVTFRELGNAAKNRSKAQQGIYLADERVRDGFASGLVEVLDRDITPAESTKQRGWDKGGGFTPKIPAYRPRVPAYSYWQR